MTEDVVTIDLSRVAVSHDRDTLSGRESGHDAKRIFELESSKPAGDEIVISVPDYVSVVTPSFFIGLLDGIVPNFISAAKVVLLGANTDTQLNLAHALNTISQTSSPYSTLSRAPSEKLKKFFYKS